LAVVCANARGANSAELAARSLRRKGFICPGGYLFCLARYDLAAMALPL